MTGDVIKSFLVSLGFDVDESDLAKFNKSIATAATRVTALFATVQASAAGIVYGISEISKGFEQMGYEYRLIAPAINKTLILRREMLRAYSAAGINIYKVVQASVRLNLSLEKTKYAFEAIYKGVASKFFGLITKQSDVFRQKIYQNMPKIQHALEFFVKFIFKALQATTELGTRLWSILSRVYDFFVELDHATNGWSTKILGVIAAWEALNLSFLATPLGAVLAGLVAILALYDDFKVFQEGGKSFFNWTPFLPVIAAVKAELDSLVATWRSLFDILGNVVLAFYQLFHLDFHGFFDSWTEALKTLLGLFSNLWDLAKKLGGVFGATAGFLGGQAASLFGNGNVAANLQNNPVASGGINPVPVSGNVQNAQTNQHVNQQTNINVIGAADANSVGKAVAGEQSRVNYDMTRNFKPAAH